MKVRRGRGNCGPIGRRRGKAADESQPACSDAANKCLPAQSVAQWRSRRGPPGRRQALRRPAHQVAGGNDDTQSHRRNNVSRRAPRRGSGKAAVPRKQPTGKRGESGNPRAAYSAVAALSTSTRAQQAGSRPADQLLHGNANPSPRTVPAQTGGRRHEVRPQGPSQPRRKLDHRGNGRRLR